MEVAVMISTLRNIGRFVAGATFLSIALTLSGCGEMTVNTLQSRNAGIKQYSEGEYAEASSTFRLALRGNPADYPSHYYLGASLAKMGSYEQAIEQYKTTLDLMNVDLVGQGDHPFRMQAINSLAEAIVASKDADIKSITLKNSPPAENQFLIAKVTRGEGDADAALEAYTEASLLAPKDFDIAKDYGLYLVQLNQNDRARKELHRAYMLNSKDAEVAMALRQVGVVPGPSLKDENDVVRPIIPLGPIPEVQVSIPASDRPSKTPGAAVPD
jgi:Flp pilus assembly protein TadD